MSYKNYKSAVSAPLDDLVEQLSYLPGIGERSARRLLHDMLRRDRLFMKRLAASLLRVADEVRECPKCRSYTTDSGVCKICSNYKRDVSRLCVVASVEDREAVEATDGFNGHYFVLHGLISPLDGIGPAELKISELLELSLANAQLEEVIIATPPSLEGEATALLIGRYFEDAQAKLAVQVKLSRIASGIPVGGDLCFVDKLTLQKAFSARKCF